MNVLLTIKSMIIKYKQCRVAEDYFNVIMLGQKLFCNIIYHTRVKHSRCNLYIVIMSLTIGRFKCWKRYHKKQQVNEFDILLFHSKINRFYASQFQIRTS